MTRVALLTCDLSPHHGWARYSLSLLGALRRAGVDVTVIASRNSPDVEGVTVHRLLPDLVPAERGLLGRQMLALPSVRALVRDCDVVHATVEPFAPLAARLGKPCFVTAHGSYVQILPGRRWPAGAIYEQALQRSQLVCVSRYTARVAQAELPGVQTTVIRNGIDVEKFSPPLPALDTPKRGPTVLSVGAVKPRKGTLELVRAMAVVRQQMPSVQCVIIGALDAMPEYSAQVQAAVHALGLEDCVHLLGHVPEAVKLSWYGVADVFALPSMNIGGRFEGYGLVHAEASAAGLPVIGTTDCGAEDAIDPGVTGLLVEQAHVGAQLPDAILTLLRDPALRTQMGAAGHTWARQHTWDDVAQRLLKLYNEILGVRMEPEK
ncbi:MAG: glycosyltransferase family 4 protein [Anaerolineae bacterium]|nr:glycosyltransferase family 4 protein [Anaerolineae bacterium]